MELENFACYLSSKSDQLKPQKHLSLRVSWVQGKFEGLGVADEEEDSLLQNSQKGEFKVRFRVRKQGGNVLTGGRENENKRVHAPNSFRQHRNRRRQGHVKSTVPGRPVGQSGC